MLGGIPDLTLCSMRTGRLRICKVKTKNFSCASLSSKRASLLGKSRMSGADKDTREHRRKMGRITGTLKAHIWED
jgi:hypothetical protein